MAKENNLFDKIFNRLLGLGIETQKDLAHILGISSASVWKARRENRFPKKWVSILSQLYDKSPEWILGIEEEAPPVQMEVSLVKSLVADIAELKNQLNYMEGTISLLREEMDIMKAPKYTNSPKKTGENCSTQKAEVAQETQKKKVA